MSLNLAHFLAFSARNTPEKTAVILDKTRVTYAELHRRANRVANALKRLGIRRGDKVAMMLPNTPDFPTVYYGILSLGAVVVPVNIQFKQAEIQHYLEDSDARAFIVWHEFHDDARQAFDTTDTCHDYVAVGVGPETASPVEAAFNGLISDAPDTFDIVPTMPDDTCAILYTSGTTGHPKGAELTHFNLFFNAYYVKEHILHMRSDDVSLAVLPLFHSFGQTAIMNAAILAGTTITLLPRLVISKLLEVIHRDRVSVVAAVPTMYALMLNAEDGHEYDLSSIRVAVSGGAALPLAIGQRFRERFGFEVLEGYGLTETSPVASFNVMDRPNKPGSIGLPLWGTEMRIARDDGSFAEVGEVGEVIVQGHNVMKGYYKRPAATEEAIVDGWFHTGDMGRMDEDGYFHIIDRKKDIIIQAGMNIYPREIEEALHAHPAVLEAAVVGVPHATRGETVRAYVVCREDAGVDDRVLKTYCRGRLAAYKTPREVVFVDVLPKGPTGKILKRELLAQAGHNA